MLKNGARFSEPKFPCMDDEIRDWLTNLDIRNAPVEHGNVHSGFWNAYQELRSEIVSELNKSAPKHIWITGHSLGGAMALCCAYDLEQSPEHEIQGLVTFGQPKLGDKRFAKHIDSKLLGRYFAFSNDNDPVVDTVPLSHPCGSAVWFDRSRIKRSPQKRFATGSAFGNAQSDESEFNRKVMSMQEFQELRNQLSGEIEPQVLPAEPVVVGSSLPIIRDHDMTAYINKLRHHFGKQPMS
jgi:pimeloyl-ACP methyl ester carboxylesterase